MKVGCAAVGQTLHGTLPCACSGARVGLAHSHSFALLRLCLLQAYLVKLYTTDGGAKLLRRKCAHCCAAALTPGVAAGWLPGSLLPAAGWSPAALFCMLLWSSRLLAVLACPNPHASPVHGHARAPCRTGEVERQIRYNVGKLPVAYRTEPDGRWAPARAEMSPCGIPSSPEFEQYYKQSNYYSAAACPAAYGEPRASVRAAGVAFNLDLAAVQLPVFCNSHGRLCLTNAPP